MLTATVGGKQLTLAQVPLTVLTLSYEVQAFAKSHVLVLVSCKDDEEAVANPACLTTRTHEVGDAVADANSAIAALNGMSSLGKQAGRTRDEIVVRVRAGMAAYQAGDADGLEGAIAGLAAAADDVESLGGSGVRAVHEAISRLLRECERRWAVLKQ